MRYLFLKTTIICFFLVSGFAVKAQDLIIGGTAPDLYVNHKVVAKENFYSVGRLYNVSPKDIAGYNNLSLDKGLDLGATIKIPLTAQNFSQDASGRAGAKSIPVHHLINSGEGLFRVSTNYNKVPIETLKKWNNLSSDAVKKDQPIIVGYIKANDVEQVAQEAQPVEEKKNEVVSSPPNVKPDAPKEPVPAVRNPEPETIDKKTEIGEKPAAKNNDVIVSNTPANAPSNFNGGKFKTLYEEQSKSRKAVDESGASGVFKSTSGWQDGKYYCFHNTAQQGTILKITNSATGKIIYAKVLDLLPDMKQNAGLVLLVSNAAASELGLTATRFDCSISYTR
ncbi:MAG: LysM peptidoglycan-binding domain-containing protein [Ginsengibacter sp.]